MAFLCGDAAEILVFVTATLSLTVTVRLEPRNWTEEPRTELVGSGFFVLLFRFWFLKNRIPARTEELNRTEEPNAQA
jgi:hypothetical protein